jgi:hypothetical protein
MSHTEQYVEPVVTVLELTPDQFDDAARVLRDNLNPHSARVALRNTPPYVLYGATYDDSPSLTGVCAMNYPRKYESLYAELVYLAVERDKQRTYRIGSTLLEHVEGIVSLDKTIRGIQIDSYPSAEPFYFNHGYKHTTGRTAPDRLKCRDGLFYKDLPSLANS